MHPRCYKPKLKHLSSAAIPKSSSWRFQNVKDKSCPEISIERLNSNQSFIDEWIDQQILQQLKNILSVDAIEPAKVSAASEAERCRL